MSDGTVSGDKGQVKQSRSSGKAGSRDAKALKNNANRNVEAADMPDLDREAAIADRISGRGNKSKPSPVVKLVLRLAEKGYSPSQMKNISKVAPHETTIYRWMREDPDFSEEMKGRYRDFVDDTIRQALPVSIGWLKDAKTIRRNLIQAKKLVKVDGLKPFEKVQAIDKMLQRVSDLSTAAVNAEEKYVHRALQIAGRQLPKDWGERADGEDSAIFFDVHLTGPIKTSGLPGSPDGQNVKALQAGKWDQKALPAPGDAGGGAVANDQGG